MIVLTRFKPLCAALVLCMLCSCVNGQEQSASGVEEPPAASSDLSKEAIDPLEEAARLAAEQEQESFAQGDASSPSEVSAAFPGDADSVAVPESRYESQEWEELWKDSEGRRPDRYSSKPEALPSQPAEPVLPFQETVRQEQTADIASSADEQSLLLDTGDNALVIEEIVVALLLRINNARTNAGLAALAADSDMDFAASIRSYEALQDLSHTRPDGSPYHTAFDEAGFAYAGKWHGENLALLMFQGIDYDEEAIASALYEEWAKSPGHERNMMDANFEQTGLAVSIEQDGEMTRVGAAQLFASL